MFAVQLREPDDGCGTCGFWRDGLEQCGDCGAVAFCCERCRESGEVKHKLVCEAYQVIDKYRRDKHMARELEVD